MADNVIERLAGVAIIRGDETYTMDKGDHSSLRYKAFGNRDDRKVSDTEGFVTTTGRFVGRGLARAIGMECGQVRTEGASLLSSEVEWDARPRTQTPKQVQYKGMKPKRWPNIKKRF